MAREWTERQRLAISTRDRTLLVSAAAGSGKTAVLTERIIQSVLDKDNPINISDMLIVTFTNAATGELRERIASAVRSSLKDDPTNERLLSQLHLLPSAKIKTIDAFCSDILRANCERAGVSPGYRIADEAEAQLLAEGILDGIFGEIYEGELPSVASPEELAALADCLTDTRSQGDLSVIIRSLYDTTKDTVLGVSGIEELVEEYNPEKFVSVEKTRLGAHAMAVLQEMLLHFKGKITEMLDEHIACGSPKLEKRIEVFNSDLSMIDALLQAESYAERRRILIETEHRRSVTVKMPEIKNPTPTRAAFKSAKESAVKHLFQYSEEEWRESYAGLYSMLGVLVRILKKFHAVFTAEKLRLGICEYSDVSRYTYECLWSGGERTEIALAEAAKYKAIYVDEYQDVNEIQHKIFEAISCENNRFMVGDIKQSIYAFRGADPTIFADMKTSFPELDPSAPPVPSSLFMSNNFRCDRGVVDFVNAIFDRVFPEIRESIGFMPEDALVFSKKYENDTEPEYRSPELCILSRSGKPEDEDDDGDDADEGAGVDAEVVAEKIRELIRTAKLNNGDPVAPGDIAIIMRNAKGRDKEYATALAALGIPSSVIDTTSFFLNPDVLLTLSLLEVIDNPRRDIYLAAAIMSPLFGFTADDLARITRIKADSLYDKLVSYVGETPDFARGVRFLAWLKKFRMLSETLAVDRLIARLYRDTGVLALSSVTGGKEHLLRLFEHARQFEGTSLRGLYNFLSYINGIISRNNSFDKREAELQSDSVKIITAHASKGLEFPIVFFVDAEKEFKRRADDKERLVYERGFGIGLSLRTPSGLALVSNPTKDIILNYRLRHRIEEEARVLYVVLTRARERLYVVGHIRGSLDKYRERIEEAREGLSPYLVYNMKNYIDMIFFGSGRGITSPEEFIPDMPTHLRERLFAADATENGDNAFDIPEELPEEITENDAPRVENSEEKPLSELLLERFSFVYPNEHRTRLPEKLSVSRLYPEILDGVSEEELMLIEEGKQKYTKMGRLPVFATGSDETESAKRGIATHLFFQFCNLELLRDGGAEAELSRLVREKFISRRDAERVRLPEVEAFVRSPLFAEMLSAKRIWRELRFNTRLPAEIFTADKKLARALADDSSEILVQGVIDCLIEDENGDLHLVDYKTDRLTREERENPALAEKRLYDSHSLQLSYYAEAVNRMLGRYPTRVEVYSLHLQRSVDVKIKDK